MLFKDHKDVDYVSKWLRNSSNIFIISMRKYMEWTKRRKIKIKIEDY